MLDINNPNKVAEALREQNNYLGTFNIEVCDTPIQTILEIKFGNIEIADGYIKYSLGFTSEEKDSEDSVEWKETKAHWVRVIRREEISCLDLYYHNANKLWTVSISSHGVSKDIDIFFVTQKEATIMFKRLEQYYLDTKS